MIIQLVEVIAKITGLISSTGSITDSATRKKLGKEILDLHQSISRIADNAKLIEIFLQQITDQQDKAWMRDEYSLVDNANRLKQLLKLQQNEIMKLRYLFNERDSLSKKAKKTYAILDIYGHHGLGREVKKLLYLKWGISCGLLDISEVAFGYYDSPQQNDFIILPRTLDLTAIPKLHELAVHNRDKLDFPIAIEEGKIKDFIECISTKIFLSASTSREDFLAHSEYILKQALDLKTSQMLDDSSKELATFIRSNFKIEEIF